MKHSLIISVFLTLLITACGTENNADSQQENVNQGNNGVKLEETDDSEVSNEPIKPTDANNSTEPSKENHSEKKIDIISKNGKNAFLVSDLVKLLEGDYQYDDLHRLVTINIEDQQFKIVDVIPVVEHNGLYLPTDQINVMVEGEDVFLPVAFLEIALGLTVTEVTNDSVAFDWSGQALPTSITTPALITDQEWNVDEMVKYLSFLEKPIEGAQVSTIASHLPGAKRGYRNGFHEGIDWYGYATNKDIGFDTPVYAMGEGVVVRADHNYEEYPSALIRNKDLSLTAELGETPLYILDRLRGKQVWVQYEKGIMNRFAHLSAITEGIKVGDKVTSNTIIGYVGNSGTSGAVKNDGTQLHLHQDLLIYGDLFWKPFSLEEVKEILLGVFSS